MIIFGSNSRQLAQATIAGPCDACGTSGSVNLFVFQRYAHIFWIPTFPAGKKGASGCSHCAVVYNHKQFPPVLAREYQLLKASTPVPWWTFTGSALLVILIILSIIGGERETNENTQMIDGPLKGDVYDVKLTDSVYTLYKVDHVSRDSVFLLEHNYQGDRIESLPALHNKRDNEYRKDVLGLSREELRTLFAEGTILDVERR